MTPERVEQAYFLMLQAALVLGGFIFGFFVGVRTGARRAIQLKEWMDAQNEEKPPDGTLH